MDPCLTYHLPHSSDTPTSAAVLYVFVEFDGTLCESVHFFFKQSFVGLSIQRVKFETLKIHSSNNIRGQPSVMTMADDDTSGRISSRFWSQICTLLCGHGETTNARVVEHSKSNDGIAFPIPHYCICAALHKSGCAVFDNGLKEKLTETTKTLASHLELHSICGSIEHLAFQKKSNESKKKLPDHWKEWV